MSSFTAFIITFNYVIGIFGAITFSLVLKDGDEPDPAKRKRLARLAVASLVAGCVGIAVYSALTFGHDLIKIIFREAFPKKVKLAKATAEEKNDGPRHS